MIEVVWPWVLLALPLPLLYRRLLPASAAAANTALRVPSIEDFSVIAATSGGRAGSRFAFWLAVLAWCCLLLAAMRPQWLGDAIEIPVSGRDLMLAVDLSKSMQEVDFILDGQRVDRLTATKRVVGEFIERRVGDRIGLVLFGTQAYLHVPLTFDRATVQQLLDESLIGLAGPSTAIGDAIGLSVKRLRDNDSDDKILVLITDGANTAGVIDPVRAAELAAQAGLTIHTIGIGADEIMVRRLFGSFRFNPSRDLDEKTLRAIAEQTNGRYFRARDLAELEQIYAEIDKLEPVERGGEHFRPTTPLYPWPLGAAVLLGGLAVLLLGQKGRSVSELGDFHFLRPLWLLLFVPFAFLCWRLFRHGDAAGVWQSVCDEALLPYLLVNRSAVRNPVNPALLVAGGLLAIVALAGPTWERLPTPVFRDESALVILLDLSRSMNAEDVSPSRLERAKFKITDMLRLRREGQTALIVYAAEPYVVTPLTTDVATIESHLPALKTNIMPSQGSDAAAAIEKGIELLQQAGVASGDLVLVTDGVDLDEGKRASSAISGSAVRLSILGVGTSEGAPIPDLSGGFITDAAGAIILKALDTSALDRLAAAGNGLYQSLRTDDDDVNRLLDRISNQLDERNAQSTDLFADRWREFGPWLLLALLPFAPLAFRRGVLVFAGVLAASATLPVAPAAAAWWQTPDQAAQAHFDAGDFTSAAETFDNPQWRAAAHYRADDFEGAVENVAEDAGPQAQYNKGNALARLGRFEEAIEAYETTLAALPDHEDAQHNKALLEDLLKEQEQQQQESDSDASEESENQDQSGESGGEQSNQRSDSKPSESESQDSAEQDPGADEQSASTTSSDQESDAEAQADEDAQTAEEQQVEADEAPAEKAEDAFAAANSDLENEQATEQWLRQIPDDPGGLLRRKFEVEYQRKHGRGERRTRAW